MIQEQVFDGGEFLKKQQEYPFAWVFVINVSKKGRFYVRQSFPSLDVLEKQQSPDFNISHLHTVLSRLNDAGFFAEQLRNCIETNKPISFNLYNIVETSEICYVLKLVPVDDDNEVVHTVICCLHNQKKQRSYYKEYLKGKYFMQKLYEIFSSPFYITNNKDVVIEYNNAAKKNIAYTRQQRQEESVASLVEETELINEDYSLMQPDEMAAASTFEHKTIENKITGLRVKGQNHVEWYRTFTAYLNLPGYGTVGYNESITAQKRVEENIISINNILNAIINSTTDTIAFVNTDNKIAVLNNAAFEHYRKVNERPISLGEEIIDVIPRDRIDIFNRTLEELKQKKQVYREHELVYPNDQKVWFHRKFYPVYDERNQYLGYVIYSEDISRQKEYELTLYRQNEQLNEIAKIQTEELITPLTTVSELIKMLVAKTSLNQELLTHLKESALQLEAVIKSKTYIALL